MEQRDSASYQRYSREIGKMVNIHQLDILAHTIERGYNSGELTHQDVQRLSLELNKRAKRFGEKEFSIELGPLGRLSLKRVVK